MRTKVGCRKGDSRYDNGNLGRYDIGNLGANCLPVEGRGKAIFLCVAEVT